MQYSELDIGPLAQDFPERSEDSRYQRLHSLGATVKPLVLSILILTEGIALCEMSFCRQPTANATNFGLRVLQAIKSGRTTSSESARSIVRVGWRVDGYPSVSYQASIQLHMEMVGWIHEVGARIRTKRMHAA